MSLGSTVKNDHISNIRMKILKNQKKYPTVLYWGDDLHTALMGLYQYLSVYHEYEGHGINWSIQ